MVLSLDLVTYLVRDYDEAIEYFVGRLGFDWREDTRLSDEKRWVRLGAGGGEISLACAVGVKQRAALGNQSGGRVGFFLASDDFDGDYSRLVAAGVDFIEAPRTEAYGRVVVFRDLYGNKWDLSAPLASRALVRRQSHRIQG